ncbi:MAG: triose-phosphate isomerase [Parcubacteria group bacterium CG08_land_8_20_14_0_20_43_9]|nr:MAG: triose-phosphate isomerase [Parcubacteria group bacterium CG08_land_8_20_14_0_20_43_9]
MRPLIVANWKCNPSTFAEAKKLFIAIDKGAKGKKAAVVICPPFVFIPGLSALRGSFLKLGAQDAFPEEGAFTGQVSIRMLKQFGCEYAIIGHSEKRALGETNEIINKKIKACLDNAIIPIFCIGESGKERKEGKTGEVLERQLELGLKGISKFRIQNSKLIIVYEPIWAISKGKDWNACDAGKARQADVLIRKIIAKLYGKLAGDNVRIIYGGSVNPDNALEFIEKAKMDGLLSGAASLDAKKFIAILSKF